MPTNALLLKGGTLLLHDDKDYVHSKVSDLLVEDGRIAKIGPDLSAGEGVRVIDCKDKLISPGFIDTHRHFWQTLVKGHHADQTLIEYFPCGNFASKEYTPEEFFWGQLSGCLEALDAGTTTAVDHAHCLYSPDCAYSTIQATVDSGIRCVYCYTITPRVKTWSPFEMEEDQMPDWAMETFDKLIPQAPFGDGRVKFGFCMDFVTSLPTDKAQGIFKKVRDAGSHLITLHAPGAGPNVNFKKGKIAEVDEMGLLGKDVLFSHANWITDDEIKLLTKHNAHVSTTPTSELQMGFGEMVALYTPDSMRQGSLGLDSHCFGSASMPLQMNLALQAARSARAMKLADKGKWSRKTGITVREVYNLGTVNGARACGMEGEIGVIREGARADLVVFDALSPGMLAAAVEDPVSAIVLHSSVRDVECVIVDGEIRKENGVLKDVEIKDPELWGKVKGKVTWAEVCKQVLKCREVLGDKVKNVDFQKIEDDLISSFGWDRSRLVD